MIIAHNFIDLPMENLDHSICILLEILEKMCVLLEYYKFAMQYHCNFSSIPSNQSQYYSHFGTDRQGSTLLLRPTYTNHHYYNHHISAKLVKLVTTG